MKPYSKSTKHVNTISSVNRDQQDSSNRSRSKTRKGSIDRFMIKMNDRLLSKKRRIIEVSD